MKTNDIKKGMVVKLHKAPGETAIILYKDSTIQKEPGLFAYGIGKNIIYSTLEKDSDFVEVGKTYTLTIKNTESGNFVSANTELIDGRVTSAFNMVDWFKGRADHFISDLARVTSAIDKSDSLIRSYVDACTSLNEQLNALGNTNINSLLKEQREVLKCCSNLVKKTKNIISQGTIVSTIKIFSNYFAVILNSLVKNQQ